MKPWRCCRRPKRVAQCMAGRRPSPVLWPEGEAGEQRPERTADQGVAEDESTPAVASGEPAPRPPELLVADLCTGFLAASPIRRLRASARARGGDRHRVLRPSRSLRDNVAALELGDRVEVLSCDLGEGVDPTLMWRVRPRGVNPPYVPTAVMDDIPARWPNSSLRLALDGGADGLDVLRRLLPLVPRALKGGRRLRLRAARDLPGRGRPPLPKRPASPMCSRHGRSRQAPASSHRPKARRVGRIFGASAVSDASPGASDRTRRPARAGQAYALPVYGFALGCAAAKTRFWQSSAGSQLLLRRMPKRNPRSRFAILQNAVSGRVVGAKTSILLHVTPAKRCARPVGAASAQNRRSWNPPELPEPAPNPPRIAAGERPCPSRTLARGRL